MKECLKNQKPVRPFTTTYMVLFAIILGSFVTGMIADRAYNKPRIVTKVLNICQCMSCHNRTMAMTIYMRNNKVVAPETMAKAVLSTSRPKWLAAIHVKGEGCTPYTARKTGYKNRHSGGWQVSEKDWGPVPKHPVDQALQADRILDDLVGKVAAKPTKKVISKYGGDSTDKYWERVSSELSNVP